MLLKLREIEKIIIIKKRKRKGKIKPPMQTFLGLSRVPSLRKSGWEANLALRTFAPKNFPHTDFFKTLTDGRK